MSDNLLYYGDNLDVLRRHVKDETVDLVYLDPPFKSNQDYNVLFAEHSGERSAAQIRAFEDTWRWDLAAEGAYRDVVERGGKVADAMRAMRTFLGESDMLAYLAMMAPRLVELRRVLKPTGSIYLHCDCTASHYLKMLMDAVFSPVGFVNEIIWKRTNVHNDSKRWSSVADAILFYVKGKGFTWNPVYEPLSEEYVASKYRYTEPDGRRYRLSDMRSPRPRPNLMYEWKGHKPHANGWAYSKETMERLDREGLIWYPTSKDRRPYLKRYLENSPGTVLGTVWTDIDPINAMAAERLGYPTQKPEPLLERIITASSNPGDTVLDPFCGCGTAVAVAQRLKRRWVGIDITHLAITLIKHRMHTAFGGKAKYRVVGEPVSVPDAAALAESDPYQFQWWALGLVGARPAEQKKGADKGIDGRIYFHDEGRGGETKQVILSVKAGNVSVPYVRDLRGVLDREGAAIGALICMEEPTQPMRTEAASAGFYSPPVFSDLRFPRLQLLTVADLLGGKRVEYPRFATDLTFKSAPRAEAVAEGQATLFGATPPAAADSDAAAEGDDAEDEGEAEPAPKARPPAKRGKGKGGKR